MAKQCTSCKETKAKERFPRYGTTCSDCKSKLSYDRKKLTQSLKITDILYLITDVDYAYRTKNKTALWCACTDIVKFCYKNNISTARRTGKENEREVIGP